MRGRKRLRKHAEYGGNSELSEPTVFAIRHSDQHIDIHVAKGRRWRCHRTQEKLRNTVARVCATSRSILWLPVRAGLYFDLRGTASDTHNRRVRYTRAFGNYFLSSPLTTYLAVSTVICDLVEGHPHMAALISEQELTLTKAKCLQLLEQFRQF